MHFVDSPEVSWWVEFYFFFTVCSVNRSENHFKIIDSQVNITWNRRSLTSDAPNIFRRSKDTLTYGAVGPRPVGVANAGPRVGAEGAVIGALLWTSALQDLAADAPPARVAVALAVMTGSVTGAHGV